MRVIMPQIADDSKYTVCQASEVLGVHRDTIRRWVNSCLLKPRFSKINGRKFFLGKDLKKFWMTQY